MPLEKCLTETNLDTEEKDKILAYQKIHLDKGLNEKQSAREALQDYHKDLFNDLKQLKKSIGISVKKENYNRFDHAKEVEKINKEYDTKIAEAKQLPQSEPIVKADGNNETQLNEAIQQADNLIEPPQKENISSPINTEGGKSLIDKIDATIDNIKANGLHSVLPDFLKSDLPEGTQQQGINFDKAAIAALETVKAAMQAGKAIVDAIEEGFNELRDYYKSNTKSFNEDKLKDAFAKSVLSDEEFKNIRSEWLTNKIKGLKDNNAPDLLIKKILNKQGYTDEEILSSQQKSIAAEAAPKDEERLKEPEGDGEKVAGIAQRVREKRADVLSLSPAEIGVGWNKQEALQRGRELIRDGINPDDVISDFNKDGKISDDTIAIVQAKAHDLALETNKAGDNFGINSQEYNNAKAKEDDWLKATKPMQTVWSRAGVAQQGDIEIDTGTFTGLSRAFKQQNGRDFTSEEAKKAHELSDKVKSLSDEVEKLKNKLTSKFDDNVNTEKTAKKYSKKAKDIADNFRKLKTKPFTFKDENGNEIPIQIQGLTWDDLVEGGAKIIEKTGEIADGIASILDSVKDTSWYKSLSDKDKLSLEQQLRQHYEGNVVSGKIDLTERFSDKNKTDNEFSSEEAKDIWEYAKKEYLDKGTTFKEMLAGVSMDLGLTPEQVRFAFEKPKGNKVISDEMYRLQNQRKKAIQRAKIFVKTANQPKIIKALKVIPSFFFEKAIFGHGTVGMITHAGMNIFRPSGWATYFPNFLRQFKYSFGGFTKSGLAAYEKAMEDLTLRNNFILAKRAGLANDPESVYDDYQGFKKFFPRIGLAGDRGFNALKVYRQDLFDSIYDSASEVEKADPDYAKTIAMIVNHSTGTSKIPVPEGIGTAFFAPRLEASRWSRLIGQPAKAVATFTNWKNATDAEKASAKIIAKRSGEMLATYIALLAANQAILSLTGSNQKINLTNPADSDWLKFKAGGVTFDISGGMVSTIDFIGRLAQASYGDKRQLKGKTKTETITVGAGKYVRGKLSPFGSTSYDFLTHHDFLGNTLPPFRDKPENKYAHKMTWKEYLTQRQLPIPLSEAFTDVAIQMKDKGMDETQIGNVLHGIFIGAVSGGTGARIMEDYKATENK